jgi:hypothetical protein
MVELGLRLENGGMAPATNIDVFLNVPDGIALADKKRMPEAPQRPNWTAEEGTQRLPVSALISSIAGLETLSLQSKFFEDEKRWHVQDLRHGDVEDLTIVGYFGTPQAVQNFTLGLDIRCNELPEPVRIDLHIVTKAQPTR